MSGHETFGQSVIWRYEVSILEGETISEPLSANVVHVGIDGRTPADHISLWLMRPAVTAGGQLARRQFYVHGTGHDIPPGRVHCGSVFQGPFVWHVFEVRKH